MQPQGNSQNPHIGLGLLGALAAIAVMLGLALSSDETTDDIDLTKELTEDASALTDDLLPVGADSAVVATPVVTAPTPTTTTLPADARPIPDVTDMEFNDALIELFDWELRAERVDQPSNEVPIDHVIRTDPPTGTRVAKESTITIYVSTGPEPADG